MEKINEFFKYLFEITPGPEFKFYLPVLILAGLLILTGTIFIFVYNKRKKYDFAFKRMFKNVSKNLVLMGILFLFLIGTRYENIPYFSMRFLLYISMLLLAYILYRYTKIHRVDYKKELSNPKSTLQKPVTNKPRYLPNKKKK